MNIILTQIATHLIFEIKLKSVDDQKIQDF